MLPDEAEKSTLWLTPYLETGLLPDVSPHSDTNGIVIEAEVDDNKNGEGEGNLCGVVHGCPSVWLFVGLSDCQ